jgi:O-antigen/teichoic acid export membrane protein
MVNTNDGKHPNGTSAQARFIRDSYLFSICLVLVGCCGIIRSFFIARLLGPQAFGTWRFINIFAECLHFSSLGTQPALHRWVPFLHGQGDTKQLQIVLGTASTANLYSAIAYGAVVFLWSLFITDASNAKALAASAPVILLLSWMTYSFGLSVDIGLYRLRRRLEIVHALLTMLLSLALVSFWGVYGAIAGWGVSALITNVMAAQKLWPYYAFSKINFPALSKLVATGLPIMADIMLPTVMSNVDKILIAATLSSEMLGIYSVGNAGVSILGMIPSAFGQMLFVKFAEMDGLQRTKEDLSAIIDRTTLVLSTLFAPLLAVAIAFFPVLVHILLPQYVRGIAAGKLLIAAVFFLGVSLPVTNWCVSTGRFVPVIALRIALVIAEFLVIYLAIKNGASLEAIAFCVLSSFAVFCAAMIIICNHLLEKPLSIGMVRLAKSMLPFLTILTVLWIQNSLSPMGIYISKEQLLITAILASFVSLAVSLPFIYWTNKSAHLTSMLFKPA